MARHHNSNRIELLQGTLDMLILRMLLWGPRHGYSIGQTIRAQSSEILQVETGSLYPALHRLEKRSLVKSEWKMSEANRPAKYYRITPAGRKALRAEQGRWRQLVTAIAGIMNPARETSE